ncbi:peptidoglycan-binding protein [Aquimarina hainanensis]|uniref:Peptidoglycan-binding protein n=1 Tax=Aquimarina hainanensis TaxID=1578017 RepID=A0ABW5NGB0_9FLAO
MKKEAYKKELLLRSVQRRNGSDNYYKEVMKIQSWLTLFSIWNPNSGTATAIDGDFGPATEKAVKNFQQVHQMEENGYVDQHTFNVLTLNLKEAFEKPLFEDTVRGLLIEAANNHLMNYPFELEIRKESNSGPWVRSYMDGNEGNLWYWCMGFVQTIIDQVWSHLGKDFRTMMPLTYSCDTVGNTGLQKGFFIAIKPSGRIRI